MTTRRFLVANLVLALGLLVARPAEAASPTETLQALFSIANTILQAADPARGPDEPRQSIRSLVDQVVDYPEAAALALGPVWKTRKPDEQAEFLTLFADSLDRDFVAMAGSKVSVDGGLRVEFLAESVGGDTATVSTTMATRDGTALSMDYSMLRRQGRWVVRDVAIEGQSLLAIHQAKFAQFLGTSSFTALLEKMRDNALEAPRASQSSVAPAPPSLAKPPARVSPSTATRYWVQVGAFKSAERAARVAEELRSMGIPASSGPMTSVPGHEAGALARVRVGPFPTRAAAQSKLRELAAQGYLPFITKSVE